MALGLVLCIGVQNGAGQSGAVYSASATSGLQPAAARAAGDAKRMQIVFPYFPAPCQVALQRLGARALNPWPTEDVLQLAQKHYKQTGSAQQGLYAHRKVSPRSCHL